MCRWIRTVLDFDWSSNKFDFLKIIEGTVISCQKSYLVHHLWPQFKVRCYSTSHKNYRIVASKTFLQISVDKDYVLALQVTNI